MTQKFTRAIQRAVGTTPDVAGLNSRLAHILTVVERQEQTIAHLQWALDSELRREFDSLASAHAEGMVYLNRTLREIRVEVSALVAARLSIEDPAPGQL